jgi:glutamyl-tRNA synthetase
MNDPLRPRFRIAPSPTGYFHVGGARTALYNWALAKRLGGTFVLRIEDTDAERNRPEWTQGIIDALAWIGISSRRPARSRGRTSRATYAEQHVAAAQRLFDGGHAYYCDMTARQIEARNKAEGNQGYRAGRATSGLGPGRATCCASGCRPDRPSCATWCGATSSSTTPLIEDFVLLRGNGSPMFLLANVVDDMTHAHHHVLRAEEHLPNTPKQQMMWEALGHEPPVWAHVPLLVNEQRKKISKRRDKVALEQYRDEGYLADAMVNYLMTLGWTPKGEQEIQPWSAMEGDFLLEDVNQSPAFFDLKKLAAFNGEYIRKMTPEEFVAAAEPWIEQWREAHPDHVWDEAAFLAMAPFIQQRATVLSEAPGVVDFMIPAAPAVRRGVAWPRRRHRRRRRPGCRHDRRLRGLRLDRRGAEGGVRGRRRGARVEGRQGAGARSASRSRVAPSARRCTRRWSCSAATRRCAGCARCPEGPTSRE